MNTREQTFPPTGETLGKLLKVHEISPEEFSDVIGMPMTEVAGILEGRLRITHLRAIHLATFFNTGTDYWLPSSPQDPNPKEKTLRIAHC